MCVALVVVLAQSAAALTGGLVESAAASALGLIERLPAIFAVLTATAVEMCRGCMTCNKYVPRDGCNGV